MFIAILFIGLAAALIVLTIEFWVVLLKYSPLLARITKPLIETKDVLRSLK